MKYLATAQLPVAMGFAVDAEEKGTKGMVMQLTSQHEPHDQRNSTRNQWVDWVSPYTEHEHLFYGYNNTILIKNIWIWTYSKSDKRHIWRSLKSKMNALNYWCKISMGHAGDAGYKIPFDGVKYKKSDAQKFLIQLIKYELDYYVTIDASKSFDINGNQHGLKYIYDFGDNTKPLITEESIVRHQYTDPGAYQVTVDVIHKNKGTSRAILTQRIYDPSKCVKPATRKHKTNTKGQLNNHDEEKKYHDKDDKPYACLCCNANKCCVNINDEIIFDASKSHGMDKKNQCKQFAFNFGDNTATKITTEPTVAHKYLHPGVYEVKVKVFDSNGLSSLAQLTIRVSNINQKQRRQSNQEENPTIMINSSPTNCHPKAAMKWIPLDEHRYCQQFFHHMLVTNTGKRRGKTSFACLDVDFRGIRNEKIKKKLRKYFLEDPNDDDSTNWTISRSKLCALYPNLIQYADELGKEHKIHLEDDPNEES